MFTIEWWFVLVIVIVAIVIAVIMFIRFTIVREGTAKAVMTLGKFSKIIFQWENQRMTEKWKILRVDKKNKYKKKKKIAGLRIWGGLYLYGIWPIHRIHHYKHRWTDIRMRKTGKMDIEFHEEELDHVLLKPAVYAIQLFAIETAPPERIPVDVLVLITLRIENPFLFLFVAPPTPIEDVLARISASMRVIITGCILDDLLRLKGESLWTKEKEEKPEGEKPLLIGTKVIEDTLEKWGMKLADKGIEIKEINLPLEYQKAAAMQRKLEFEAAARSAETVGTVIEMMARARGHKNTALIQSEIEKNPGLQKEFLDLAKDLVVRKLGIEGKSYLDIRVQGAKGIERTILNALAVWQKIPMGEGKEKNKEEKSESEQEPKPDPLTADPALSERHTEVWRRIREVKKKYPERWNKRKRRKRK